MSRRKEPKVAPIDFGRYPPEVETALSQNTPEERELEEERVEFSLRNWRGGPSRSHCELCNVRLKNGLCPKCSSY